jgi:hypothetical protein
LLTARSNNNNFDKLEAKLGRLTDQIGNLVPHAEARAFEPRMAQCEVALDRLAEVVQNLCDYLGMPIDDLEPLPTRRDLTDDPEPEDFATKVYYPRYVQRAVGTSDDTVFRQMDFSPWNRGGQYEPQDPPIPCAAPPAASEVLVPRQPLSPIPEVPTEEGTPVGSLPVPEEPSAPAADSDPRHPLSPVPPIPEVPTEDGTPVESHPVPEEPSAPAADSDTSRPKPPVVDTAVPAQPSPPPDAHPAQSLPVLEEAAALTAVPEEPSAAVADLNADCPEPTFADSAVPDQPAAAPEDVTPAESQTVPEEPVAPSADLDVTCPEPLIAECEVPERPITPAINLERPITPVPEEPAAPSADLVATRPEPPIAECEVPERPITPAINLIEPTPENSQEGIPQLPAPPAVGPVGDITMGESTSATGSSQPASPRKRTRSPRPSPDARELPGSLEVPRVQTRASSRARSLSPGMQTRASSRARSVSPNPGQKRKAGESSDEKVTKRRKE